MLNMSGRLVGNRCSDDWLNKVVQFDCNFKILKLIYNTNEMYIIYSKSWIELNWNIILQHSSNI